MQTNLHPSRTRASVPWAFKTERELRAIFFMQVIIGRDNWGPNGGCGCVPTAMESRAECVKNSSQLRKRQISIINLISKSEKPCVVFQKDFGTVVYGEHEGKEAEGRRETVAKV
jgi:hypothetical protein